MQINILRKDLEHFKTTLLVVPIFSDKKRFPKELQFLENHMTPDFDILVSQTEFEGKLNEKRITFCNYDGFPVLAILGAGKEEEWGLENARVIYGTALKIAQELKKDKISVFWNPEFPFSIEPDIFLPEVIAAMVTAEFRFKEFQTDQKDIPPQIKTVDLIFLDNDLIVERHVSNGEVLGRSINLTRTLAEYPSNLMTPRKIVDEIEKLGKALHWELEIFNEQDLIKKRMNALLAVSQGSEHPPFLAIARYMNPDARKTVAMIGKGVTFDTGGISLKPSKNMEEMKYDMCGAAAVLGALSAITQSEIPINIVAAFPLVENMPSGSAIRPGDVVKSYSGKTIEIINTDAEGRLILADTLSYVEKNYRPDYMVDLATLTGAVVVALGNLAAGVLTNDKYILQSLQEAAAVSGDKIWQLPLWDDYKELMKSKIADIRNTGTKPQAGTITGAIFLKKFVEKTPWAHLDIAGTAYDMPEKSYRPAGATGFGVKLLWHWANILSKE
jgi:leucyl aminopeptidase